MTFDMVYDTLKDAIRLGPHQQIALVQAVDEAYALMEAEELSDEQVLSLRLLISHAEGLIGRYFGM
ncbi:hypothetical protein D3C87_749760 [compost metagenome]